MMFQVSWDLGQFEVELGTPVWSHLQELQRATLSTFQSIPWRRMKVPIPDSRANSKTLCSTLGELLSSKPDGGSCLLLTTENRWLPLPTFLSSQKWVPVLHALWTIEGVNTGPAAPLSIDTWSCKSKPLVIQSVLSLHPQTLGHCNPCYALYTELFLPLTSLL